VRSGAAAAMRLVRLLFPLTVRGLVILALALGLLLEGVLRADLAGLFWGSSFLLFTVYALAAGHLFRLAARRTHGITLHLPAQGLVPGEESEAAAAAHLPRSFPPGFSVQLSLPLTWEPRRIDGIRRRMSPGQSQARVAFRADHRGIYRGSAAILEAHDVLGLTAHRLVIPRSDTLVVYPAVIPARELLGVVEQSEEAAPDSRRRRRSEELLEARKYYPGDDVRRLNWKVFAHTDELFLRIGEEVPPPESRILFVLDSTANPFVPRAVQADYLDSLVQSCASVMIHLVRRGLEVAFSRPGQRECRSFGSGSQAGLLTALAGAWWTTSPWVPELPARTQQAVVFSSPGSPGLPAIMSTVAARGWRASLYLQDMAASPAFSARALRELLLVPQGEPRGAPRRARRRERSSFARALARDLEMYRGAAVVQQ
jgi:uncharacterized protein (DUF58 family)